MVMQTRSNSARTFPADGYDDFYADDRAVSPVEAGSSDSEMFMEKPGLQSLTPCYFRTDICQY